MRSIVYHQAAGGCTPGRDEIQGRLSALDDMHRTSCGDDMPSLREPPKLSKLASGNPYCGLDKQKQNICLPTNVLFLFFQAAGLVYHRRTTCGVYHQGRRAALVSHHAPACILLRLDDMQCFALMIYRNKLRMIYTPSA